MKNYIFCIFFAAFALKAGAQGVFQKTPQGTEYKMLSHNTGDRIKLNEVVTFQVTQKTEKDSLLASTYQTGKPAQAQVQPTGNLMDIFPLLTVKDSVLIKVPTDTIFKNQEDHRPSFLPKGSSLMVILKIEKVQSLTEAMAERDKAIAEAKAVTAQLQAEEAANTNKYIVAHNLVLKTTASGLKYKITKATVNRRPLPGDTVFVNYTGRTLDGKVFDSSIEADAKAAGLQQPGRIYEPFSFTVGTGAVIPGWDEGLLLLNTGSKATFIVPSALAYGETGAGESIKPFSTLLFNVELVKIKPIKHPPAAKKPAAKSPVKKPAAKKKK